MRESPPAKGAPKWMATFADMSTLLLTFFVLMLSFANIDIENFREMLGSVAEAYGVTKKEKGEYQPIISEKETKTSSPNMEASNPESQATAAEKNLIEEMKQAEVERAAKQKSEKVESMLEKSIEENKMNDFAELIQDKQGLRVRINGFHMFEPGGADIKRKVNPFLDTLYEGLIHFNYHLIVEGHTDNLPIRSKIFPSNWELSSARAASVVRYLIEKGIDPKKLMAVGYADNYPIADNNDPVQRGKNRRVEFIFCETLPRIEAVPN